MVYCGEEIITKAVSQAIRLGEVFEPIYSVEDAGVVNFNMLLNTKWVSLDQRIEVRTPIDDSVIATVPSASDFEADEAVESSFANRNSIRTIPAVEKIETFQRARELLLQQMDTFTSILSLEAGKPMSNAEGEVKATADLLKD